MRGRISPHLALSVALVKFCIYSFQPSRSYSVCQSLKDVISGWNEVGKARLRTYQSVNVGIERSYFHWLANKGTSFSCSFKYGQEAFIFILPDLADVFVQMGKINFPGDGLLIYWSMTRQSTFTHSPQIHYPSRFSYTRSLHGSNFPKIGLERWRKMKANKYK